VDRGIVNSALDHFLKRHLRNRLFNRLVAYVCVNLAAYMLLLTVVILTNSSLFVFHLLLFCSLSLLPFFLFAGLERTTLGGIVRSIDKHCLIESYLQTTSVEHRSFMRRRVESYLEHKQSERAVPFRLSRANFYLIALCLAAFLLLQSISFVTLRGFTTSFSARNIKNRLIERFEVGVTLAGHPLDDSSVGGSSTAEEKGADRGGETVEKRAQEDPDQEAFEELLSDEQLVAKDKLERLRSEDASGEVGQEPGQSETDWIRPTTVGESDATGDKSSGIPVDTNRNSGREGSGAEAGSSDVGRTFRDSPLREYTAIAEEIATEGGEELSPSDTLAESRRQIDVNALFSDFYRSNNLRITFHPLFDTIRERYLELLNERF
jgi:hypothetical protein